MTVPEPKTLAARAFRLAGRVMGFDPFARLDIRSYSPAPRNWPQSLRLRIVVLADLHACRPYMESSRITYVVDRANALSPDIILLLGDYMTAIHALARGIAPATLAANLSRLTAPLGVHAVLGNHDWWEDPDAQARGTGPCIVGTALAEHGIVHYENSANRLEKDGHPFWIAGLGDQRAFLTPRDRHKPASGIDDLDATLTGIADEAPVILMAHEPDIFPQVPDRVSLTLSGHTHGGQIKLFGQTPVVPSIYGSRYVYGHIREEGRDLVVSGGLGCSGLPIRFGVPPEIVLIELGGNN